MRVLPKTTGGAIAATMVAGFVGVLAASFAFVIEYAIGGQGGAPLSTVLAAMTGVHALIGIGEGLISAVAVGAVLAVRPDLVTATADLGLRRTATAPGGRAVTSFVAVGLAVALALVFLVAPMASGDPDGLERVAIDQGFSGEAAGPADRHASRRLRGRRHRERTAWARWWPGPSESSLCSVWDSGWCGPAKAPHRVSGAHAHALHYHGHSPLHRAAPQVKLAGLVSLRPGSGDDTARRGMGVQHLCRDPGDRSSAWLRFLPASS